MEVFDPMKAIDGYEFNLRLIRVSVFGMPLCPMTRRNGDLVRNGFHEVINVADMGML